MVRLKLEIITLVLFLSSVLISTSVACASGIQQDSAGTSDQLREGAVSLRLLGYSNTASFGGKYHFSDHQAVQVTFGINGNGNWQSNYSSDYESNHYSFSVSFGIGAQYLHYFKPESILSPFVGCGPNTNISFDRSAFQENSDNTISYSYDFGLDAIFGLECKLSKEVSLVSEYIFGIKYYQNRDKNSSPDSTELQEYFYQRFFYSYRLASLGIAFYIR